MEDVQIRFLILKKKIKNENWNFTNPKKINDLKRPGMDNFKAGS